MSPASANHLRKFIKLIHKNNILGLCGPQNLIQADLKISENDEILSNFADFLGRFSYIRIKNFCSRTHSIQVAIVASFGISTGANSDVVNHTVTLDSLFK